MVSVGGMLVTALMLGIVSETISDKIEDLKKGTSDVLEDNHRYALCVSRTSGAEQWFSRLEACIWAALAAEVSTGTHFPCHGSLSPACTPTLAISALTPGPANLRHVFSKCYNMKFEGAVPVLRSLILGWSDKVIAIVNQLCNANESEGGLPIVILSEQEKVSTSAVMPCMCFSLSSQTDTVRRN